MKEASYGLLRLQLSVLLTTITALLRNARSRVEDIMGPSFFESMDRAFFFPSIEKDDRLTSLDRGKPILKGQKDLSSLIAVRRTTRGKPT